MGLVARNSLCCFFGAGNGRAFGQYDSKKKEYKIAVKFDERWEEDALKLK
jgi:hypothetical protein